MARKYQMIDENRGRVFVLTQWAEYMLYEFGSSILESNNEWVNDFLREESIERWEFECLREFCREYAKDYDLYDGHARLAIEIDHSGKYAFADENELDDWVEERDIDFLENPKFNKYKRVYLPSILIYAEKRN